MIDTSPFNAEPVEPVRPRSITPLRRRPLVIDLCCGLGGWTHGFLAEGYDCIGFDIERHQYGAKRYPAQLVLQDITTLHGSQFRGAAVIVASPPCQAYSYRAMPWKRAKALPPPDNTLFETCFRIAREAGEAATKDYGCAVCGIYHPATRLDGCEFTPRYIPLVVENVKGAQPWVGRAAWHYGSYYLWGDVPAIMPFTRAQKIHGYSDPRRNGGRGVHLTSQRENDGGIKQPGHSGRAWFADPDVAGHFSSKSDSRKAASAMIAEIPFDLAQHIARCFKPRTCDIERAHGLRS